MSTPALPTCRKTYFDSIATKWDGWEDLDTLAERLDQGLAQFGIAPDETVVDMGSGTGNLTLALARLLGPEGRAVGVDFAPEMVTLARQKTEDPRISWECADARDLPFGDGTIDRIMCYSMWPHVTAPDETISELRRVLAPGSHVHVWHLAGKDVINGIHSGVGGVIAEDILEPAADLAARFESAGFTVTEVIDTSERYLITARAPVA